VDAETPVRRAISDRLEICPDRMSCSTAPGESGETRPMGTRSL
jgi:hypothetical protein